MSHTPGPWHRNTATSEIEDAHDESICDMGAMLNACGPAMAEWRPFPNHIANARLIIAAPELLEACKTMVANIESWLQTGVPADAQESEILYHQMVTAIAKAEDSA